MAANYEIVDMRARARQALDANAAHTEGLLAAYARRLRVRNDRLMPEVAILGHGRSGKDTAAEYLCVRLGLHYGGSSSTILLPFIAHMAGLPPEVAWGERHAHREFWIAGGHAVRDADLTLLCRMTLGLGDLAVGLRGRLEIEACVRRGTLDYLVWVDNPRVPPDPTMELAAADCDLMVPNHGSHLELYRKLDRLTKLLSLRDATDE